MNQATHDSPYSERRTPGGRVAEAFVDTPETARRRLAEALAKAIDGEVRFDVGSRALYATDASNYRQVPLGVVVPRHLDDVVAAIALCHRHAVPVVMRGGGTSLAGQGCNVAVLIDFSKYLHRICRLDPDARQAEVEPGCVLDSLRDAAETHHLTFGPDPATHDHNTLGGMLGNNSCGVHSIMAGRTADNVAGLEILTYDGLRRWVGPTSEAELKSILQGGGRAAEIYRALDTFRWRHAELLRTRYPRIPRRVSGYADLDALLPEQGFDVARALVGTEGTCVTILRARLDLIPSPPHRALCILGFADVFAAADAVPLVLELEPIGLEGIDQLLVDYVRAKHLHEEDVRLLPSGGGWLVAEFGGDTPEAATEAARRLAAMFEARGQDSAVIADRARQQQVWELREAALAATAHVPGQPESWPGWEDSAVPRDQLGQYLRELKALFRRYGYEASVYGHFGDGLVHCRVPFDLRSEEGLTAWRRFLDEAADLVVRHGGSLSGEHGDGQARAELLERMYGPELTQAFREFKAIWDPDGRMNPGKVVAPYPITSNLRVGPRHQPAEPATHFAWPEDEGSFVRAMRRCVGVGACRRGDSDKGVMCPSYMVTREERHSTRGRARLLFEMLEKGPLEDGWKSREVEEALDLCLACKGCKSDCPVQVDMASYKAEFRAHHYAGRLRPRAAWSMGLIHRWARLGARLPWLANALTGMPGLAALTKAAGGVAQARRLPRFPRQSFVAWHRRRPMAKARRGRVVLWPDTFNNYLRPGTAKAATLLLEHLGFAVEVPRRPLCCGRPLYDWGRLEQARALWRRTLDTLVPAIAEGAPVIGLEPACVSAFRDELLRLFPQDEAAQRLAGQTQFLTEFLAQRPELLEGLHRPGQALVQLHCHHHAVIRPAGERQVLESLGLEAELLSAGCCGMAGSFGFETAKYELSQAAAERVLLPRVRQAAPDTLILANGYSCREQIEQGTGRATTHVAELLAEAAGLDPETAA